MTQTLFIDKSGGTFADSLLAFGLAVVVDGVLGRTGGQRRYRIHLSDHGSYYRLGCSPGLDDDRLAAMTESYMPAVVIRTRKNAAGLPVDLPPQAIVDYEVDISEGRLTLNVTSAPIPDSG